MVDRTGGQLYTIEGFSAALIMLVTAWIVLESTSVYTPGDTHISDMQLEQLGTDVLAMMDIPVNATYCAPTDTCTPKTNKISGLSDLQHFIANKYKDSLGFDAPYVGPTLFNNMFLALCNNRTEGTPDHIQYTASIFYRDVDDNGEIKSYFFNKSRDLSAGDHAVRVTRWVFVDNTDGLSRDPLNTLPPLLKNRRQEILVEVLIWRG